MPKFEVETDLIIHVKVKLIVEAADNSAAIDAAYDLLPHKQMLRETPWKATVVLKPPKGATLTSAKPYFFEQASGGEKARKIA